MEKIFLATRGKNPFGHPRVDVILFRWKNLDKRQLPDFRSTAYQVQSLCVSKQTFDCFSTDVPRKIVRCSAGNSSRELLSTITSCNRSCITSVIQKCCMFYKNDKYCTREWVMYK